MTTKPWMPRGIALLAALMLPAGCSDTTGPTTTTYGLELTGATAQHGAAVLTLRNLPANLRFTGSPGVIVHARPATTGQGYTLLVAGDLTKKPLLTVPMPTASSQTGTILELANVDGSLVTGSLPAVVFVPR